MERDGAGHSFEMRRPEVAFGRLPNRLRTGSHATGADDGRNVVTLGIEDRVIGALIRMHRHDCVVLVRRVMPKPAITMAMSVVRGTTPTIPGGHVRKASFSERGLEDASAAGDVGHAGGSREKSGDVFREEMNASWISHVRSLGALSRVCRAAGRGGARDAGRLNQGLEGQACAEQVLKERGVPVAAEVCEVCLGHIRWKWVGDAKISQAVGDESVEILLVNQIGTRLAGEPVRIDEMARSANRMDIVGGHIGDIVNEVNWRVRKHILVRGNPKGTGVIAGDGIGIGAQIAFQHSSSIHAD